MFLQVLESNVRQLFVLVLSLALPFQAPLNINQKAVPQTSVLASQLTCPAYFGLPALPVGESLRLVIPKIKVNSLIEEVGTNTNGEMAMPSNVANVGWFSLGPRPGESGSAVITGHVNSETGAAAVFTNLNWLVAGDKLAVEDSKGAVTTFVVREKRSFDPGYADEVFTSKSGSHLNLVTCEGIWNSATKSYSKRLVVFTDKVS